MSNRHQVYDLPIADAAQKLQIGVTVLKKYCRRFNIPRWPYRKIKSLDKLIESVYEYSKDEPEAAEVRFVACFRQR